jgi:hypothetical protein
MLRREFLFRLAGWGLLGETACSVIGCGSLMHSERCGQPHGRDIDWKVVALDGLGLILFFIPGVVAFAVDFYTGAIYLPEPDRAFSGYTPTPQESLPAFSNQLQAIQSPSQSVSSLRAAQHLPAQRDLGPADLKRVLVVRDELSPERIELVVTKHMGRQVSFNNSDTRISRLPRLDRFACQCLEHHTNHNFGFPVKTFFDGFRRAS